MSGIDRRSFLRRSAAVGAAGLAGAELTACGDDEPGAKATPATGAAPGLERVIPFEGHHQAGVLTPPSAEATYVALDAIAPNRATLFTGLQQLSATARTLTQGYRFRLRDHDDPPPDSGTVGTTVPPDRLTVTIAFGASLFDDRYGLSASKPAGLKRMPSFPDDDIDASRAHGDVLITLNAAHRDTVTHALRELLRPVRAAFGVRWTIDGFLSAARGPTPHSARRNLFGFRDGTSNPSGADLSKLLWLPDGSTFQVVRTIRMHVEFWDRVGLREQENMIGRTRDGGEPIGGDDEHQNPRFDLDPKGARIPLDAHIRLANPRSDGTAGQRILRQSFNYHRGIDPGGQLDQGLLFVAFNRSIEQQFEAVQRRLAGEPMTDYVTPVGGGYYVVPPAARNSTDWVGSGLST